MAFGCVRAGGFVDIGCTHPECDCHETMQMSRGDWNDVRDCAEKLIAYNAHLETVIAAQRAELDAHAPLRARADALALQVLVLEQQRDEARTNQRSLGC
jgi:hypothetical protein